jgi:hypothetical protein
VIVEVGVGDSNPISTMGNVKKSIKVIFSKTQVTGEIAVVNPNVGRLINANGITIGSVNLGDLEVSKNNVLLATNIEANTSDCYDCQIRLSDRRIFDLQLPAAPMIVLSDAGRTLSLPVNLPETMMVRGSVRLAASIRAATEVTVTVEPLAPPVVPPFWVQYPTVQGSAAWRLRRASRLSSGEATAKVAKRVVMAEVNFMMVLGFDVLFKSKVFS